MISLTPNVLEWLTDELDVTYEGAAVPVVDTGHPDNTPARLIVIRDVDAEHERLLVGSTRIEQTLTLTLDCYAKTNGRKVADCRSVAYHIAEQVMTQIQATPALGGAPVCSANVTGDEWSLEGADDAGLVGKVSITIEAKGNY